MASDHNNIIYVAYIAGQYNNNYYNSGLLAAVVTHGPTTCFLAVARATEHWLPWKFIYPDNILINIKVYFNKLVDNTRYDDVWRSSRKLYRCEIPAKKHIGFKQIIIYKCAADEITESIRVHRRTSSTHDMTIKHLDGGSREILAEVME